MTVSTITPKQQQKISDLLSTMILPKGVGDEENACSIAAINLALTGVLTDRVPACMSEVIGEWIIGVQDGMPFEMRNSTEWKKLLPLAAGTGRKREGERLEIILAWMWKTVLPTLQPIADQHGFGDEWRVMLRERTGAANAAALANANAAANAAATAAYAANANANATAAAYAAATANATALATALANAAAYAAATANAWQQFNPCGLLERLIAVN